MREQINGIKENVEIDLKKLLLVYLRKWWLIVACALVAALGTFYVTANHITPTYRAGVTVYVNNTRSDQVIEYLSNSNLEAAKQLVSTYTNIISSNTVLEQVVRESGLSYTPDDIRDMMSTQQVSETEIFRVYITHPDPYVAAEVANAIASVAPAEIEEFVEGSSAKIIDYAKIPTSRYSPSYEKNTVLGAVIGAVAAVLYLTLRYLLDVRIKDSEDIEMLFEIPILGQIPNFVGSDSRKKDYSYELKDAESPSDDAQTQDKQETGDEPQKTEKPENNKKSKSKGKEETK